MKAFKFHFFLFFLISINTYSLDLQKYGWTSEQIDIANTAKSCKYLSEDEQQVILLVNLARTQPHYFSKVMLAMWFENTADRMLFAQMCSIEYSSSLIKDLENCPPLSPLLSEKRLYKYAMIHAQKIGQKGRTGHGRYYNYSFLERMQGLNKHRNVAENCSYGCKKPIDIVMQLLLDDGVPSLGHRKNILKKSYKEIGISIQPHKKYEWNCVMDFDN